MSQCFLQLCIKKLYVWWCVCSFVFKDKKCKLVLKRSVREPSSLSLNTASLLFGLLFFKVLLHASKGFHKFSKRMHKLAQYVRTCTMYLYLILCHAILLFINIFSYLSSTGKVGCVLKRMNQIFLLTLYRWVYAIQI